MIEITLDGQKVAVPSGSMLMDAANKLGTYIPHFCYHKKLSIAANCRMCLVDVEKAPKPLPACATPATAGMVVKTKSAKAIEAQKGVMEFLLINHPLDCPICDQGGECQLQDLAVGYGGSNSRYQEEKRVVFHKNVSPLVGLEEMSRCIHCTRCVRFGQEIAGVMELGMINRGEHSEITTYVGQTIDSELSGNMIDLCPVGALTSKPFRYAARTWELSRFKSISPHDGLGANLIVQVKNNQVLRVVPLENEDINECWLSDKERFSYEALNSPERLTRPMLKQAGAWQEVAWAEALAYVTNGLQQIVTEHGPASIAAAATPHSTLEELYLLQKLIRGLGSENIDTRLRQSDFSLDFFQNRSERASVEGGPNLTHAAGTGVYGVVHEDSDAFANFGPTSNHARAVGFARSLSDAAHPSAPWLGMRISEVNTLDRFLIIGSFLRKDHPLLAQRIRGAAKAGAQVNMVHATDANDLIRIANQLIVAPSAWTSALAQIAAAIAQQKNIAAPVACATNPAAQAIATSLLGGHNTAIFFGNSATQHPQYSQLRALAQWIAEQTNAKVGVLSEAANSVGAYIAKALPGAHGLNARTMFSEPRQAYLLLNAEPEFDSAYPLQARTALQSANMVVALCAFKDQALEYADVLLPIAPFSETSGTFVNCEGRAQSFHGITKPLGETRPGWKVLRVLGNLLGLAGFDYETSEAVRDELTQGQSDLSTHCSNQVNISIQTPEASAIAIQRVADVPIYFADALVRRAPALQKTRDAQAPKARMNQALLNRLGLSVGDRVHIRQQNGSAELVCALDDHLADDCVQISAAHQLTAGLDGLFGSLTLEKITVQEAA